jgi:DNA primase
MTIAEAKDLDIVDYLSRRGYQPQKISGSQYWYSSPFREEQTPSFKVNRKLNRWFDFGEGEGGNLIDLGIRLQNCTVSELLKSIDTGIIPTKNQTQKIKNEQSGLITILSISTIRSQSLINYIHQRKIKFPVAEKYLVEVHYQVHEKNYYSLGFKNDSGGYELRSAHFKGSSSPKDTSFIDNGTKSVAVFEGFFDFLSYCSLNYNRMNTEPNFLILNSASFFEKNLTKMRAHEQVRLFLDNDDTGTRCVLQALSLDPKQFIDERKLYQGYQDLNDWLIHSGPSMKQGLRRGL